jgi:hypothetical protein
MEGEQQALVQLDAQTDLQRVEACKRRFDEAGKDLDEARNALAQWKDRHRDFNPRDPILKICIRSMAKWPNIAAKNIEDVIRGSSDATSDLCKKLYLSSHRFACFFILVLVIIILYGVPLSIQASFAFRASFNRCSESFSRRFAI